MKQAPLSSTDHGGGKRRGLTSADAQHLNHILYFGRRDLEKGRAPAARPLFAIVVDLRFDCLADVYLEDIALLRRVTSLLRKAKARSVAAGDVISHIAIGTQV